MPKRMLIDASHPEETRVVVLDGSKVEEFDFESASKRPLKGNIYLAKVTRVEPSLQAAFVEYGGNRQGFLAFSEIHPDYYQIPVADRQALLEAQARRLMAEDEFDRVETGTAPSQETMVETGGRDETGDNGEPMELRAEAFEAEHSEETHEGEREHDRDHGAEDVSHDEARPADFESGWDHENDAATSEGETQSSATDDTSRALSENTGVPQPQVRHDQRTDRRPPRARRRVYKIQEVIKRRQIMLVQVVKEERGTKGASLTTFMSLAGRYCVLMPNTPRGGGISRKITSATDRKRLKSAAQGLELPEGMGLIIRTAGATRTKLEIKRDYEYLLRLWDSVRELTLKSNAPALVYEEGNLVKRAIRDLYAKDISEVVVDGDAGYRDAKDFMKMIMPSHAKNVKPYKDTLPLFQRHHVEAQLDQMFSPTVTLKSGGYIVINQTEALVSIDVNSGKATREHSIEDTAHKTNLEAADEIGRQLRLRDLAGLIVIDFIDMEDSRNDRNVEKRLRDATKNDRARVQFGKISQFGLLEMSRQRLRAGVIAGSTVTCPHCAGQGIIRSTESAALRLLRALDEEGQHQRAANLTVKAPPDVTIYALNQKRREIARIEEAYDLIIAFDPQQTMMGGSFEIERTGTHTPSLKPPAPVSVEAGYQPEAETEIEIEEDVEADEDVTLAEPPAGAIMDVEEPVPHPGISSSPGAPSSSGKRRRRRGGRGRGGSRSQQPHQGQPSHQSPHPQPHPQQQAAHQATPAMNPSRAGSGGGQPGAAQMAVPGQPGGSSRRRRRRRGRGGSKPSQPGAPQTANNGNGAPPPSARSDAPQTAHRAQPTGEDPFPTGASESRVSEPRVSPNAPSSPQWSFTPEPPSASQPQAKTEPTFLPAPAERVNATPAEAEPPRTQPIPEAGPPGEKRGGWWQRNFRSGS